MRLPRWLRSLWAKPGAPARLLRALRARPTSPGRWTAARYETPERASLGYHLYEPSGGDGAPRPLLVLLHGCRQAAREFAAGTRITGLADRQRFLVLCPEQEARANPLRCWNWFNALAQTGQGESGQIAGLIRHLLERHGADPQRVYVAGLSAGAAMAQVLAVCHGELFAGCAVHSGLRYGAANSAFTAGSAMRDGAAAGASTPPPGPASRWPVPTLVIHGRADRVVNPVNAEQIVEQCCAMALQAASVASIAPQTVVTHERRWTDAERQCLLTDYALGGTVVVRRILIDGLAHAWSGGDARYPFNDAAGPDATALVWEFFSSRRRLAGPRSA